jgi:NAD+--asparagine ADP-ribosyltransferase
MKTLTCIAALGAALLMTHSAFAANPLAKACAADIKAQCADVKPGGGKLKDCVKAHFSDLSADCQVAIVRAAAEGKACKADAKKLCADVKGGQRAKLDCLKEHAADLSDDCKEAMAKAEAGKK